MCCSRLVLFPHVCFKQDAIRMNFKRYKSDPRVLETVRRVQESQRKTRELAKELEALQQECVWA